MKEYTMSQYASKDDLIADMRDELSNLRAENERLREALLDICQLKDQECYAVAVAKEALK